MCPTLEENGIKFKYYESGNCSVEGPIHKVRLNIEGARMASFYGVPQGEEFFMGVLITSFWGCTAKGIVALLFGENTLLNVDPKRDNWFLKIY